MRDTSKPLASGQLNHRLTIEAPAGTLAVAASEVAARVPAAITVLPPQFQSREGLQLGGLQSQTVYTVSIRTRTDLQPSYVLVEECCTLRRFQILNIVPSDRRDALDMTCVTSG